ncbi:hypothetical protein M378DRAFT_17058 [Amanita muscaria Koide BX008]|uniref:Uncharacterized protein n=1 Tax=Amanita muscaria (strain Koide BX008) TaxID=946122 RepID=A0A0C2SR44_AMAMK|nr:hypothetical protein M378DRAFT_17058 [Amanita muscaria Koide BX008]
MTIIIKAEMCGCSGVDEVTWLLAAQHITVPIRQHCTDESETLEHLEDGEYESDIILPSPRVLYRLERKEQELAVEETMVRPDADVSCIANIHNYVQHEI